jgi:ankyrin repeat protein
MTEKPVDLSGCANAEAHLYLEIERHLLLDHASAAKHLLKSANRSTLAEVGKNHREDLTHVVFECCERGLCASLALMIELGLGGMHDKGRDPTHTTVHVRHPARDSSPFHGATPLHVACMFNQPMAASLLLAADADPDARMRNYVTPMMLACEHSGGDTEMIVHQLFSSGADPGVQHNARDKSAMSSACSFGKLGCVHALISRGVSTNLPIGGLPLWLCCVGGHLEIARLLLRQSGRLEVIVDPDEASLEPQQRYPLHASAAKGHTEMVRLLLDSRASPTRQRGDDETPLIVAARFGHAGVVSHLLRAGACTEKELPRCDVALDAARLRPDSARHAICVTMLERSVAQQRALTSLLEKSAEREAEREAEKEAAQEMASARRAAKRAAKRNRRRERAQATRDANGEEPSGAGGVGEADGGEGLPDADASSPQPESTPRAGTPSSAALNEQRKEPGEEDAAAADGAHCVSAAGAVGAVDTVGAVDAVGAVGAVGTVDAVGAVGAGNTDVAEEDEGEAQGEEAQSTVAEQAMSTNTPRVVEDGDDEEDAALAQAIHLSIHEVGYATSGASAGHATSQPSTIAAPTSAAPVEAPDELSSSLGSQCILDTFLCPITQDYMRDPVITSDGLTYERRAIEDWFARRRSQMLPCTSPLTGERLSTEALIPNVILRGLIGEVLARKPSPAASSATCEARGRVRVP